MVLALVLCPTCFTPFRFNTSCQHSSSEFTPAHYRFKALWFGAQLIPTYSSIPYENVFDLRLFVVHPLFQEHNQSAKQTLGVFGL
jgi:hypothetical protein